MLKVASKSNSLKAKPGQAKTVVNKLAKSNTYKIECIEALQEGKKYKNVKSMIADSLNW